MTPERFVRLELCAVLLLIPASGCVVVSVASTAVSVAGTAVSVGVSAGSAVIGATTSVAKGVIGLANNADD